jgi:hypothetical protein
MPSPRLLLSLTLAVAAAGSMPAVADVGRIVSPAGGEVFVAGTAVEIRWEGLPPDIDEMELLLAVDGGPRSQLRLTPQLAPGFDRYVWVVPNLPTPHATLRLRVGRHGVEVEGEPGGPFAIVGRADVPATTLRLSGGEWWPGAVPRRRPLQYRPSRWRRQSSRPPGGGDPGADEPRAARSPASLRGEDLGPALREHSAATESTAHRRAASPQRE